MPCYTSHAWVCTCVQEIRGIGRGYPCPLMLAMHGSIRATGLVERASEALNRGRQVRKELCPKINMLCSSTLARHHHTLLCADESCTMEASSGLLSSVGPNTIPKFPACVLQKGCQCGKADMNDMSESRAQAFVWPDSAELASNVRACTSASWVRTART